MFDFSAHHSPEPNYFALPLLDEEFDEGNLPYESGHETETLLVAEI